MALTAKHVAMAVHVALDKRQTICGRPIGEEKGQVARDASLNKPQAKFMAATATRAGSTPVWQWWLESRRCKRCETWFNLYIQFETAEREPAMTVDYFGPSGLEPLTDAI